MVSDIHALISEMEQHSPTIVGMGLRSKVQNESITGYLYNFANSSVSIQRICAAIEALHSMAGLSSKDVESNVTNLITERHFYGSFCELGAYGWLNDQNCLFEAQIPLTGNDVMNPKGCGLTP